MVLTKCSLRLLLVHTNDQTRAISSYTFLKERTITYEVILYQCRISEIKYIYINDYILTHKFDIIAICETWLGISDYDDTYVNVHLRSTRTRNTKYSQFECFICSLVITNSSIYLITIYRPPASQQNQLSTSTFISEWAEFISQYTTSPAERIIMGDLNIHLDNTTHPHTQKMTQTLDNCNLVQHIKKSTRYCGHTLDVLIGRDESTLISTCDVRDSDNNGDRINSHCSITCKLNCYAKHSSSNLVTFRRLKTIVVARCKEDIHMHPLQTNTTGSVDEMTENYSEGFISLLDIHVLTICSNVIQRPNAPWTMVYRSSTCCKTSTTDT